MTLNKKITWGGVSSYETPLVKTLDILSEGVLCASFGDANEAGRALQENADTTWDF